MSQIEKRITTALVGIENVYAKHVPLLLRIVASAMKGKLKDKDFPTVVNNPLSFFIQLHVCGVS